MKQEIALNVLSLFDGISCGHVALERLGVGVDKYYSSEIDKHAIKVADVNWPMDTKYRLGDINDYQDWDLDWSSIDLILAGSPCQSISNLGDGKGLSGKSGLFYKFLEVLRLVSQHNPNVKFLLENVRGNKDAIKTISQKLGAEPIGINSSAFSAQKRARLYWTNLPKSHILTNYPVSCVNLVDILEEGLPENSVLSEGRLRWLKSDKGKKSVDKGYSVIDPEKAHCLTARSDASWNSNYVTRGGFLTRLTPLEYERLQTLPDNYTSCVSNSQRYKTLGNCWTVDVICHLLEPLTCMK